MSGPMPAPSGVPKCSTIQVINWSNYFNHKQWNVNWSIQNRVAAEFSSRIPSSNSCRPVLAILYYWVHYRFVVIVVVGVVPSLLKRSLVKPTRKRSGKWLRVRSRSFGLRQKLLLYYFFKLTTQLFEDF